jgi:hypothetical protein
MDKPSILSPQAPDPGVARLERNYGNRYRLATLKVYLTETEVTEFFGEPCKDYEPLCVCCKAWIEWRETGMVTFTIGRTLALHALREDD